MCAQGEGWSPHTWPRNGAPARGRVCGWQDAPRERQGGHGRRGPWLLGSLSENMSALVSKKKKKHKKTHLLPWSGLPPGHLGPQSPPRQPAPPADAPPPPRAGWVPFQALSSTSPHGPGPREPDSGDRDGEWVGGRMVTFAGPPLLSAEV